MPTVQAMLLQAPLAVAYGVGLGSRKLRGAGGDTIFLCHGTPPALATPLELQLRYLRREFDIVPLAAFAFAGPAGENPARRRRRLAAVAFDDGLRSNVAVAYPVLRALGIPATFFVCPGLIEARKWLWTHEARRRLCFAGDGLRRELAAELKAPAAVERFVDWMKTLDLPERERAEARLRQATGRFVASSAEHEEFDLAGWDELRALDPALISVGSHSLTHPILPRMSLAAMEAEVRDSRRMLEAQLGRPAELFSYPNRDFDARTLSTVRRYYRAAVVHRTGLPPDPHLLPSHHLPHSVLRLAWRVNRQPARTPQASDARWIRAGTPAP